MISLGWVFAVLIGCHSVTLARSFRQHEKHTSSWRLWWIRALLVGVIYDNYVLFLTSLFDLQSLQFLYPLRFLLHSLLLPFLAPYSYDCMQEAGKIARATKTQLSAKPLPVKTDHKPASLLEYAPWAVFAVSLVWNVYHEYLLLELEEATFVDPFLDHGKFAFSNFTRYVKASKEPPLATIAVNILAILGGWVVLVRIRWMWLLLASSAIFIVNGASVNHPYGLILGNIMEVFFAVSLLATERHLITTAALATNPSRKDL